MAVVNTFKKAALDAVLALGSPKIMLLTNSHVTNIDTQEFIDDVSVNEISSSGYTAGGAALANVTSNIDAANDRVELDFDNPSWTGLTATVRYACIYIDTGTPGTSIIIQIKDLGSNQVLTADDLTLQVDEEGSLNF